MRWESTWTTSIAAARRTSSPPRRHTSGRRLRRIRISLAFIDLSSRDGAANLAAAWQRCALERDTPLTREQRLAHRRGRGRTARGSIGHGSHTGQGPVDRALVDLADLVTLAPWRLGPAAYEPLRELGLTDDRSVFDVVATASSAGVFSRMRVALAGLSR